MKTPTFCLCRTADTCWPKPRLSCCCVCSAIKNYVRSYCKNKLYTGVNLATKLWVGDYKNGDTFEELAAQAAGVERLGVLRADVDNLGQAFVYGFESAENGSKYNTVSRTATFSRKLSIFFRRHVNKLLTKWGLLFKR